MTFLLSLPMKCLHITVTRLVTFQSWACPHCLCKAESTLKPAPPYLCLTSIWTHWFSSWLHNAINIYLFLEREGKEKERERNIGVIEKYRSLAPRMAPNQELNPQHRPVSWLGIKQAKFCLVGWCPTNWSTQVRATMGILNAIVCNELTIYTKISWGGTLYFFEFPEWF